MTLEAFSDEIPDHLALYRRNFIHYDFVAYNLSCTNDIDPTANLDQLLRQNCLFGLSPHIV